MTKRDEKLREIFRMYVGEPEDYAWVIKQITALFALPHELKEDLECITNKENILCKDIPQSIVAMADKWLSSLTFEGDEDDKR